MKNAAMFENEGTERLLRYTSLHPPASTPQYTKPLMSDTIIYKSCTKHLSISSTNFSIPITIHRGRLRSPYHPEMPEPSDPIILFEREPTFRNLLWATPRLFSSRFCLVFGLASETLSQGPPYLIWVFGLGASCLLWGPFVGIHLLGIIAAVLILCFALVIVSATLMLVWHLLTGFM